MSDGTKGPPLRDDKYHAHITLRFLRGEKERTDADAAELRSRGAVVDVAPREPGKAPWTYALRRNDEEARQ